MTTTFRTGNGAAWLDLLATLVGRYRERQIEALDSPARLREWLREQDMEPIGAVTDADLRQVRAVREALHRAAAAALGGQPPRASDMRLLDEALAGDKPLRLRRGATPLAIARPATAAEAVARLTRAAMQDLAGSNRGHLHPCADDTCSGIFMDATRRRRWCSDQTCGNRMRVRAHRARVAKSR